MRIAGSAPTDSGARVTQDRVRLLAALTKARVQIAKAKAATTIGFVEGVVAQGEKVIVFSAFDAPVQQIAAHFGDAAVRLTGATPAAERQALVDRFQTDDAVRVFVANLVAGGVGITLTAARQVVFNDLDWVPANHWQAEDRAYRIGQTGTVNVTYFAAEGTVDEFVSHALRVKATLIEAVIEGRGDVPVDGDLLAELEALVRTLSPGLASVGDAESEEDPVDRLLREVTQHVAAREAEQQAGPADRAARATLRALPAEAIAALARVLSGPVTRRWRVASSAGVAHYVLDADGGDVTCSCRGFEYRGACRHARTLAAALATGAAIPPGVRGAGGGRVTADDAGSAGPVRVIAAVVEREGRLLVCQRPPHKRHGGLWEFPGGKRERGETDADAARRELDEELGVAGARCRSANGSPIADPGSPFLIAFVPVTVEGEPVCHEHTALAWATAAELTGYALAPSDRRFVEHLLATDRDARRRQREDRVTTIARLRLTTHVPPLRSADGRTLGRSRTRRRRSASASAPACTWLARPRLPGGDPDRPAPALADAPAALLDTRALPRGGARRRMAGGATRRGGPRAAARSRVGGAGRAAGMNR